MPSHEPLMQRAGPTVVIAAVIIVSNVLLYQHIDSLQTRDAELGRCNDRQDRLTEVFASQEGLINTVNALKADQAQILAGLARNGAAIDSQLKSTQAIDVAATPPVMADVKTPPVMTATGSEAPLLEFIDEKVKGIKYEEFLVPKFKKVPIGWFSGEEAKLVYTLGRYCPGPNLEQGPFAGLSTSFWGFGLKDRVEMDTQPKKVFITQDIFPSHPDYAAIDESLGYPFYWKRAQNTASQVDLFVDGITVGSTTEWDGNRDDALKERGGLHNNMIGSLNKNGLSNYVSVVTGAGYPDLHYPCAFFDTAHQVIEIAARFPTWINSVKQAGGKRQIFAFHDNFGKTESPSCKGIAANIFNIVNQKTYSQTWTIQVEGLHANAEEAMKFVDPEALDKELGPDNLEVQRGCQIVCERLMEKLKTPNKQISCNN